jgi:hypothetical protein
MGNLCDMIVAQASRRVRRERAFPALGVTLYVSPWSCAERAQAVRSNLTHKGGAEFEIDVLLLKAEQEDGTKAFGPHDRVRLLHKGDPETIGAICDFLLGPEVFVNERDEVERLGESLAPTKEPTSGITSTLPTS